MSAAERVENSEPATLRTARAMIAAGYRPIPIYPGKKKPIGEGWGLIHHHPSQWRDASRGLGLLLGDDGNGGGLIDFEIDDPERARPVIDRIFPDGIPDTPCFQANLGMHYVFRYDRRLARYGQTIIKGENYPGVEFRIGTIDPKSPVQEQSVIPPTPRADGTPREWMLRDGEMVGPDVLFALPTIFLPLPECVFDDLDRFAVPGARSSTTADAGNGEPTWDKEEVKAAILPHAKELAIEWGLRITGTRPTSKGFLECRAIDRPDAEPSCGFNPTTGVYTDRKTGVDLSIYQLALALRAYTDFHAAVNILGRRFGVKPATKATEGGSGGASVAFVAGFTSRDHDFVDEPVLVRPWPDPPEEAAWYGLAGKIARAVEPLTEADPIAVLIQLIAGFGNVISRKAHTQANATRHYTNLFVCTAGPSGVGRKGTAGDIVRELFSRIDPDWVRQCSLGGLTSGEGLIAAVRDPVEIEEDIKDKGRVVGRQTVLKDPGVTDKRLFAVETEFGRTLKVLSREGNILDGVIRQAWDTGHLGTMVRTNPLRATDAHVSIVGHITEAEASRYLTENQATNGFANRFLWACVRRSKLLPRGAVIDFDDRHLKPMVDHLRYVVTLARDVEFVIERSADAEQLWELVYADLTFGKPGVLGVVTSRGDAQTLRLSCLYALLDGQTSIKRPHLEAAVALWDYCRRSAAYIFGDALGDKDADHLLSALRSTPLGLSQSDITHQVFQRHKSARDVARILGRLLEYGMVRSEVVPTEGRSKTVWFAVNPATKATEGGQSSGCSP